MAHSASSLAPKRLLASADPASVARGLLAAADLDGYRAQFEQLAAIEDPHRRYQAGVSLIELGLAESRSRPRAPRPALLAMLADAVLEALEREPSEPLLLNHAGAIFHELWSLEAAQALFAAAGRLDPTLQQLEPNLAALEQRSRRHGARRHAPPLHPGLPELGARAIELAARARPAQGLRLSLCMIVRDEQEMLPRCLASVAGAVDEMVIVDTGSTDATVEIARSFGAQVIHHEWTGSFARARNVSFDVAEGDWLIYLDADEVLVGEDAGLLRSLITRSWREAFYVSEISFTGALEEGEAVTHDALRIFRNRPEYRFEGRVHEQIGNRLPLYLPERVERTEVRVEHFGYLGSVRERRAKSSRNIELLRMQLREQPADAFLHFNLGSEHAVAGDAQAAVLELERSWALLKGVADLDAYEFAPALLGRLVRALSACGRSAEAFAQAQEGLARFPDFTDLVFEQALAAIALGQGIMAIRLLEICLEMGDAPRRYAPRVGCGTRLARRVLVEALLGQGRPEEAARMAAALSPDDLLELLDTLLRARRFDAFEALHAVLEQAPLPPRERRERLAEMYLREGYAASAAEEWMAVCSEEPDIQALLGLARVAASRSMEREAQEFTAAAHALARGVALGDFG